MVFTIHVEIKGLERELERFSEKRLEALKYGITNIEVEEMQQAVSEARNTVPVKTGNLQNSIQILDINYERMSVLGGTECSYAHFVEFGTVKMHARPYWTPAVWEAFYRTRRHIYELWRELFEKEPYAGAK